MRGGPRRAAAARARILQLFSEPDHQIDARDFHSGRRRGEPAELHLGDRYVGERTSGFVVEVIVRDDVRVEPGP